MKAGFSLAICSMVEGRIPLSLDTISFPVTNTSSQQSELFKSNLCNRPVNKKSCYFCSFAYCTFTNCLQAEWMFLVKNWNELASAVVIVLIVHLALWSWWHHWAARCLELSLQACETATQTHPALNASHQTQPPDGPRSDPLSRLWRTRPLPAAKHIQRHTFNSF